MGRNGRENKGHDAAWLRPSAHNTAGLAAPLTASVSMSRALSPSAPCSFIYKIRGWVLRISSHFKTLLFIAESCYLLALWGFPEENFYKILLLHRNKLYFLPFFGFAIPSFQPQAWGLLFQVFRCYFSCCPWLCLSFLLTRSPAHSCCLLQCQSQRKLSCKSCEPWCWVRTDK